jgi:hypothetical protein
MSYPNHDAGWERSAKGTPWRCANGVLLVVGKRMAAFEQEVL